MESQHFSKGEYILREGEKADFLVIICSGTVDIKSCNSTIALVKAPDIIGESALKYNELRKADAVAKENVKAIILNKSSYDAALHDYETEHLQQNEKAMKISAVVREWKLVKIMTYSKIGNKRTLPVGNLVY